MSLQEYHHTQAQNTASQLERSTSRGQNQDAFGLRPSASAPASASDSEPLSPLASTDSARQNLPLSSAFAPAPSSRTSPPLLPTTAPRDAGAGNSSTSSSTIHPEPPSSAITGNSIGLPAGARPTPQVIHASPSAGTFHSSSSTSGLPPPHALPTDSQPVVPQLTEAPPPVPPRDSQLPVSTLQPQPQPQMQTQTRAQTHSPPQASPILPPAPAHPDLAPMRASSARSRNGPRRPLPVSRVSSVYASGNTYGVASGNANRNANANNANGNGNGNTYPNSRAPYYASATSTATGKEEEKDRSSFGGGSGGGVDSVDRDILPTSPSGRPLRIDLPELLQNQNQQYPSQYQYSYSAPPTIGVGGGGGGSRQFSYGTANQNQHYQIKGNSDPRYVSTGGQLDEKYQDSINAFSAYGSGAQNNTGYGTSLGSSVYKSETQTRTQNQDTSANRDGRGDGGDGTGGGTGGPGGPGGDANGTGTGSAYLDAYAEIGLPRVPRTVMERLEPTLETVEMELARSQRKAKLTGWCLNIAIGLQVLLSAMITALSAVTSGKRTQVMTSILGGAGTVVASYLARARGSNEPELSTARVKDLQRFQRACLAFVEDCGYETGWEGHPGYQPPPSLPKRKHRIPPPPGLSGGWGLFGLSSASGRWDEGAREARGAGTGTARERGEVRESERESSTGEKDAGVGSIPREWDGGVRARELDERIRRLRAELEHLLGNGNGERKLSQV